jgi:hypothetical protein
MVWFGEIERKLAELSKTTLTYRSSSKLFYGYKYGETLVRIRATVDFG